MSDRRLAWRLSGLALVLVLGAGTGHSAAAQDIQRLDGGFYGSCAAAAQGATRFARGVSFARHMTDRHKMGKPAVVVPGCAHSESCMFLSRTGLDALFP